MPETQGAETGEAVFATDRKAPIEVVAAVRQHHDRWDGGGQVDGMAGESIRVPARILAVSERFEALTAGRGCTRVTSQEALAQIVAGSGSEFDPLVIEALGRATREGGLELNLPDLALPATVAATA